MTWHLRCRKFHNDGLTVMGLCRELHQRGDGGVALDGGDLATNSADQSKVWSSFWSATNNGIEAANPATQRMTAF